MGRFNFKKIFYLVCTCVLLLMSAQNTSAENAEAPPKKFLNSISKSPRTKTTEVRLLIDSDNLNVLQQMIRVGYKESQISGENPIQKISVSAKENENPEAQQLGIKLVSQIEKYSAQFKDSEIKWSVVVDGLHTDPSIVKMNGRFFKLTESPTIPGKFTLKPHPEDVVYLGYDFQRMQIVLGPKPNSSGLEALAFALSTLDRAQAFPVPFNLRPKDNMPLQGSNRQEGIQAPHFASSVNSPADSPASPKNLINDTFVP